MRSQTSPNAAADAPREVAGGQRWAANPDAYLKWITWGLGAVIIGVGIGTDLLPNLGAPLSYAFIASMLLLVYVPRLLRFDSATGHRRPPNARSIGLTFLTVVLSRLVLIALVVGYLFARILLRSWDVPMPATISSIAIVLTMPLWQRVVNPTPR